MRSILRYAGLAGFSLLSISQFSQAAEVTRVLTWNVHAFDDWVHINFPDKAGPLDAGLRDAEKVPHLARRILEQNHDVVLLNEAWSEDTKEPLTALLSFNDTDAGAAASTAYEAYRKLRSALPRPATGALPYWVADAGVDSASDYYNSGLMLFSRFAPASIVVPTGVDGKFYPSGPMGHAVHYECAHAGNTTTTPDEVAASAFSAHKSFLADTRNPAAVRCSLASFEFTQDSDWDDESLSSKAVVWMRVFDAKHNRPLNVFATHLQSNNSEEDVSVRWSQLEEAHAFMDFLGLGSEDIVFAGDLNVREFNSPNETPPVINDEYRTWLQEGSGWLTLGTQALHDTFRMHLKPFATDADFGLTSEYSRLDHFMTSFTGHMTSPGSSSACAQHVRKRNDFVAYASDDPPADLKAGAYLSDHRALEMTIGPASGHCSPARALDSSSDGTFSMQLDESGGYQWIRVPANRIAQIQIDPIGATGVGVAVELFRADNISDVVTDGWPVRMTANGTRFVDAYPFDHYLRLRANDGLATGTFRVRITTPTGVSEAQALPLMPRVYEGSWRSELIRARDQYTEHHTEPLLLRAPSGGTVGQADAFYQFHLERPSLSASQHLIFHLAQGVPSPLGEAPNAGSAPLRVSATLTRILPDGSRSVIKSFAAADIPNRATDGSRERRYLLLEADVPAAHPDASYVLKLTRASVSTEQVIRVGYETNLRVLEFRPDAFIADSDNDDAPYDLDEAMGRLFVDGTYRYLLYRGIDEGEKFLLPFAWLDDSLNTVSPGLPLASLKFTTKVELEWGEHDGAGDDADDFADDIRDHLFPHDLGVWYRNQALWKRAELDYVGLAPRSCLMTGCVVPTSQEMRPSILSYHCPPGAETDLGNFDCDAMYKVRATYRLPF
ncbi:MAG: endonuclease/exonuclease/phosphatase family protein [Rhodanobacteraceae bacterium]|nr:endonuclease/exonuclease/phosphatase family protein [Rhodanobacteraceae bacterium]